MANQGSVLSMKLLIDKANKKVLFAEAGKECVDFFFHILSLPLRKPRKPLSSKASLLTTSSLVSTKTAFLSLNPHPILRTSSQVQFLTTKHYYNPIDSAPKHFYTCINTSVTTSSGPYNGSHQTREYVHKYVADAAGVLALSVTGSWIRNCAMFPPELKVKPQRNGGGYVKGVVAYMIMDDLGIKPVSAISSVSLISEFGIKDMSSLEEKEVTLDINLGVALLKASLMSNTVLTDVFLAKKP